MFLLELANATETDALPKMPVSILLACAKYPKEP